MRRTSGLPWAGAGATCSSRARSCAWSPRPTWSTLLVATAKQIMDDGLDAVIASADAGAAAEAEATRVELLTTQGADANHADEKIERIRELAGD